MMQLVEEYNLLAQEKYGSRQSKVVITQCLNKWLFYDYHRFTCQPAALCSNDAKSCYNCIILIIAALSLCRLGTLQSTVRSMIQTLAHLNHHVHTVFGDSESSQGYNKWQEGVAGIGQGNGAGPHIWAVLVSMPLFEINGFVAKFICTLSQQH